ncbi:MAG: cyclase [Planctomycetaceae bacterium]|nr:MAG: cyclase [Planctomycetaceae bacterium]
MCRPHHVIPASGCNRRSMWWWSGGIGLLVWVSSWGVPAEQEERAHPLQRWQRGRGWGWVWGPDDEVGALNEMTDASRRAALRLATQGKVYDLGITYSRRSYKWPGHAPGEILTFRSPEGVQRQADLPFVSRDPRQTAWHSCALFLSDNVATQIDGLAHATQGADPHWYNGFREREWGGDFGPRKCDAVTIPPIIARGVLIDVAGFRGMDVLPAHTPISVADLQGALAWQGTQLQPGDVVLIRTGTLKFWGEDGADHERLAQHDSAGITLESARWLVEQQGALMIGSDTSGLEYGPPPDQAERYQAQFGSFMPVHNYLLIEQGVHIGEFHYLEDLARDKVYEFCYIACTAKIRGTTAGFALRPIALR